MGFMFSLNVTTQRLWVDVSWRCFSVHQHIIHCSNTHTCWLLLISWMIIIMNMVFSGADCRQERRGLKDKVSHVPPQYRYHGELLQHRPGPQLHLLYNSVNFDPLYSVWRKMRLSLFLCLLLFQSLNTLTSVHSVFCFTYEKQASDQRVNHSAIDLRDCNVLFSRTITAL